MPVQRHTPPPVLPPPPPFSPSLISLMVSVDVKHCVYYGLTSYGNGGRKDVVNQCLEFGSKTTEKPRTVDCVCVSDQGAIQAGTSSSVQFKMVSMRSERP